MKQPSIISQKEPSFEIQKQSKTNKYNEVREKLDKLKYKFHFDPSNLQLIDLLVNDILTYQNEMEKLKKTNENLQNNFERSNLNTNAFKQENMKFIKENNELIKQNVELSKSLYSSNSSKQMEIKRLQDEKTDFKFMLNNSKIKYENLVKENSQIKLKLNNILSKIYDTNLNENSLRTMFDNDKNMKNMEYLENVESETRKVMFQQMNRNNNYNKSNERNFQEESSLKNLKDSGLVNHLSNSGTLINNKTNNVNSNINQNNNNYSTGNSLQNNGNLTNLKMGIYVKQRNIHMSNNLDYSNNSASKINDNKDMLKKVILDTFGKLYQSQDEKNYKDSNTNFNPSSINNYPNSQEQNSGVNYFNSNTNNFDYKKFKENYDKLSNENLTLMNKINTLEKELKEKNKEINRLNYLCRNENSPSSEVLIKYLKEEKEALQDKYETRVEFLINENKKFENLNLNLTKKLKNFNNQYPYISEIEKQVEDLVKKNKNLINSYKETEHKLKEALTEKESLSLQVKEFKQSFIPKDLVMENEGNYKRLHEDYTANQDLMKRLDEKVRESEASNNSTKNILFCEIKEVKNKLEILTFEKNTLSDEIKANRADKENLLDKINILNMNLLKKENDIRDMSEKMEIVQVNYESLEKEKEKMCSSIEALNDKIYLIKLEINSKDDEIHRLVNLNNILEKTNPLMKKSL